MTLTAGQILDGKYRIVRVLGVGGMGAVFEGENTRIHRRVAIKVLHANVAGKDDIVQRFEREAQAAGRIGSEHIVEVLDLGSLPGGERYMVMEFLDGDPLTKRIKVKGRLTPAELAPVLLQLLEGLGAAHQAGIVHRDLKPDNVFLVRKNANDFVKLLDFGVSKFTSGGEELSMTKTGAVMGTPYYMSPEQARGQHVDHRSDLYSVGVVAYQCLTGRVPFNAETFNELIFKIALEVPEPPENLVQGVDPGMSAIVRRSMERDPNQRFQTAADFTRALMEWQAAAGGYAYAGQAYGGQHGDPRLSQSGSNPTAGMSQSGGYPVAGAPLAQQAAGAFGQTGPQRPAHLSISGSGLSASNPSLNASGAALGQSGSNPQAHPLMGASGMGQSQVALAVTTRQSKTGASIIVGALAVLAIGAGVFFWMKKTPSTSNAQTSTSEATSTATAASTTAATSVATATSTATAAASSTSEPTASASTEDTSAVASASVSGEPSGQPVPTNRATGFPVATNRPLPTAKPTASATATAKPPPTSTGGRAIDGSL